MEIVKIIGIGLIGVIFSIVLKENKKDFAIYVGLICGILIIFFTINKLNSIILFINSLVGKTNLNSDFIKILLKITGISILTEFAVSICKDSGENAIANKIDLGGKIIVISMSIPVISNMLNGLLELLS